MAAFLVTLGEEPVFHCLKTAESLKQVAMALNS
jgi:hypothetical protein